MESNQKSKDKCIQFIKEMDGSDLFSDKNPTSKKEDQAL